MEKFAGNTGVVLGTQWPNLCGKRAPRFKERFPNDPFFLGEFILNAKVKVLPHPVERDRRQFRGTSIDQKQVQHN
jgi:hypothetical protein